MNFLETMMQNVQFILILLKFLLSIQTTSQILTSRHLFLLQQVQIPIFLLLKESYPLIDIRLDRIDENYGLMISYHV